MKIYSLRTMGDASDAIVDFSGDSKARSVLFRAPRGERNARFRAKAQRGYTPGTLAVTDFVRASTSVPIFSSRVVENIGDELQQDATFFPCTIECEGERFAFFAARIDARVNLIDRSRSTFRTLTDGEQSLMKAAYRSEFDRDFLLARDHEEVFDWTASERLKKLAETHDLAIDFIPRAQID